MGGRVLSTEEIAPFGSSCAATAYDDMGDEEILNRRLWTTQGKTHADTLSSAILRDTKMHGKQSRFFKADRSRFRRSKVG